MPFVFFSCITYDWDNLEDVPLVEFMYPVFTRMPGEIYRRRLRSLLLYCGVFQALINSIVCWFSNSLGSGNWCYGLAKPRLSSASICYTVSNNYQFAISRLFAKPSIQTKLTKKRFSSNWKLSRSNFIPVIVCWCAICLIVAWKGVLTKQNAHSLYCAIKTNVVLALWPQKMVHGASKNNGFR